MEDVILVKMNSSNILIAMIVNAKKAAQKIIPTIVLKKVDNVHANPIILAEPVMCVRMDTLIILVVKIVDALQITQLTTLMLVKRELDSVLVR